MNRSYFICATPRSGSTLLCDLLTGSGVAGRPNSFYRRQSIFDFAAQFGLPTNERQKGVEFQQTYIKAIWDHSRSHGNQIGIRMMWESMPEMLEKLKLVYDDAPANIDLISQAFGPPKFLFLKRKDKIAQAVSRAKAEQSGLWHKFADGSERERSKDHQVLQYDFERIKVFWDETNAHESAWMHWFAANKILPTMVLYENLAENPKRELERILIALQLDPQCASKANVKSAKLADAVSLQWCEQFSTDLLA